ncbi:MAG: AIR synthase-related protein [Pseudomonadota bacterium]
MAQRIEVFTLLEDGRAKTYQSRFEKLGIKASIRVVDVYTIEDDIADPANLNECISSLTNPVSQKSFVLDGSNTTPDGYVDTLGSFDHALEVGFLPGVTDNIGHTASELTALSLNEIRTVYASQMLLINGQLSERNISDLKDDLHNSLIQRADHKDAKAYQNDNGMGITIPKVQLSNSGVAADEVDLDISDDELAEIGKSGIENQDGSLRGPLGMSLLYMKAVQDYFKAEGRKPTDIEIETLAQTWSEHCKHTIFASPIDEIKNGLFKHYIKGATEEIRKAKGKDDICVSVFWDDSGVIAFDDDWLITDKMETHNSPSALDPFGGAITGIVGVNRDCIGTGLGAKPIINRYGFCLADPRSNIEYYRGKGKANPTLSSETVMRGVVAGVESGGNQSGIPSPQGFLYFDDRYIGKPLVFAGTVGLMPREVAGKPSHLKGAEKGDRILMIGGKVGRDGIHGATFSSVALDEGSPATAVQIGDPITQKKFSDAIIKEIRDLGLYKAMTDNGAGGLSSSVGEMAESSGGFHVELEKVPLKYPGMSPWEIWISESQERMTLAVPPENVQTIMDMLAKRGVEAWDIGEFTDTGRAHITWHGDTIMDMDMDFLHDGLPETPLTTTFTRGGEPEPDLKEPDDYRETFLNMLSRLNICSKEFVACQYDHNVQGTAVLGPLQGQGRVYADASVSKPLLDNPRAVVLSQGLFPRYSDIDTHHMGQAALDMAVRSAVAAGGDINHLALMDNICWCSSDEPERLGQLKRAISGIYHLAKTYGTPFISGKDSMFNDFKGYDENDNPVKISVPPTLLISALGVIQNVDQAVSLDPKMPGDKVYLLGTTKDECGASEYYALRGALGNNVPETDNDLNMNLYRVMSEANKKHLITSTLPVSYGGIGIALAKKAIAGQLGLNISYDIGLRMDKTLFSESTGRVVVTIAPQDQMEFEKLFADHALLIGEVTDSDLLKINDIETNISDLEEAYKKPLRGY